MLDSAKIIDSPKNLITYLEESGIIPHRTVDITPHFGPSFTKIHIQSENYLDAFLKYIDNNKQCLIENFKNIRFEDVFEDDDEFFESMTDSGRYNFINDEEPRFGAFRFSNKKYEFSYRLDFSLIEKQFSKSMPDFNFSEFADFMSDCPDFWNLNNPRLNPEDLAEAGFEFEFSQEKIHSFCKFANELFSIFNDTMSSLGREWHCIEYSQYPFYFAIGRGLYYLLFISRSDDRKSWDFVEFICDY